MKIYASALVLLFLPFMGKAQQVSVTSAIHPDQRVTLYREYPQRQQIDTTGIRNGSYNFRLPADTPAVYSISMRKPYLHAVFFSGEGQISIQVGSDSVVHVTGGKRLQQLHAFEKQIAPDEKAWNQWGKVYTSSTDLDVKLNANKESNKYAERVLGARVRFALQHSNDIAGAWLGYSYAFAWQEPALAALIPAFKNKPQALVTYQKLTEKQAAMAAVAMTGKAAPDFSLEDSTGHVYTLKELLKGQRYLLVDVWASWCTPCRATNRKLAPLYTQLQQKGITLVSVSVDENAALWTKAVTADNIPWLQLRTSGGMKSKFTADYKVQSLPATYLIDQQGNIIRQHITEVDLLKL